MLYCDADGELKVLPDDGFSTEKDLQTFVEKHIDTLLQLRFIATEFVVNKHNRIDTLANDEESNAFVVIEDKNVRNSSLVYLGFSYLSAILDRKEKSDREVLMLYGRYVHHLIWHMSEHLVSPDFHQPLALAGLLHDGVVQPIWGHESLLSGASTSIEVWSSTTSA